MEEKLGTALNDINETCSLYEAHQEILRLVKQRDEITRKINGLWLSCKLIYCDCGKCTQLGAECRDGKLKSECTVRTKPITPTTVDVGVQVHRDCVEEQDLWTDTSEWAIPDNDDASSVAASTDFGPTSIGDSMRISRTSQKKDLSSFSENVPVQAMGNISGEYWGKSLLLSSKRTSSAIVVRAQSESNSACSAPAATELATPPNQDTHNVTGLITEKLDLLCAKLCAKFSGLPADEAAIERSDDASYSPSSSGAAAVDGDGGSDAQPTASGQAASGARLEARRGEG